MLKLFNFPSWARRQAANTVRQALPLVAPETHDRLQKQRVEANLVNTRGATAVDKVAFYPVNKDTIGLVESLIRSGTIHDQDLLVVDDGVAVSKNLTESGRRVVRFSQLTQQGVKAIYLLQLSDVLERRLADMPYRECPCSVNDLELVTYPTGEQMFTKPYRYLNMSYKETVVPPLHYSNYTYIQYLKTIVRPGIQVFDAFAGPGTVGLSVAKECGLGEMTFFDLNPVSIEMIRHNARENFGPDFQCRAFQSNLFRDIPGELKFDLIIGNPPHNLDKQQQNVHLPLLVYIQAHDLEMKIHREFFTQARERLKPGGKICLLENGQEGCIRIEHIRELLKDFPDFVIESNVVMTGSQFYVFTARLRN